MGSTAIPDQTATDTGTPSRGALAPGSRGYKLLLTAIVVMGIMLILGVIVLGVLMAGRMSARQASSAPAAAPVVAPAVAPPVTVISTPVEPFAVNLNEPLGSQVVSIATIGDRLALHIVGGGSSRVLLVDPHDGRVLGRITLGE